MQTYKDYNIKYSYISKGMSNISDELISPLLKCTKTYKRAVGYFSSSVIEKIFDGLVKLIENDGYIKLLCSPHFDNADARVVEKAYSDRGAFALSKFEEEFNDEIGNLEKTKLLFLYELIVKGYLDIKVAVVSDLGIYHDKLGIMEDACGNKICFIGSANSSKTAYQENYDKIRVFKEWESTMGRCVVKEEEAEFDKLWDDENEYVYVYEFNEIAKKILKTNIKKENESPIKLRPYQENAILAWKRNNYHGFFVMATGTGKTWTAIFASLELVKDNSCDIVICAPYKHLVKQWYDDVKKGYPDAIVIMSFSENKSWEEEVNNAFIANKYGEKKQIVIISTIVTFYQDRFKKTISKSSNDKLLIVDEAHNFNKREELIKKEYKYMLGLSATPFSGASAQKGMELMDFFGGKVFELTLEDALKKGFLVQYKYHPIVVNATAIEEEKFNKLTSQIISCFKNNVCINNDYLATCLRNRLRVIGMAEEKNIKLSEIIEKVNCTDHFIVYCGDGHIFDEDEGEEIRHINEVKKMLSQSGYKVSQFTAKENIKERMSLIDSFNKGYIDALAAIRCLDEGVNIPSIKTALILVSNDNYREFVQRRGRILRTYSNKKCAEIYDVIVLPSSNSIGWAKIELRRFYEYGHLAMNWDDELKKMLDKMMGEYNLEITDVKVYEYENVEADIDE